MTKKEFMKQIDIQEGDSIHFIRIRRSADNIKVQRVSHNITALELMGYMEQVQLDIMQQIRGTVKPEIIERKVII